MLIFFQRPVIAVPSGGFDCEEDAARAHDVMAMKCRGMQSTTNYDHQDYEHWLPKLEKLSKVCCLPVPCHMPLVQVQASPADKFCSDLSNAALYKMSWQRLTAAGLPSVIASASAAFRLVVMLTCIQSCSKLH